MQQVAGIWQSKTLHETVALRAGTLKACLYYQGRAYEYVQSR